MLFQFQLLLGYGSTYPSPGRFRSRDRAVDLQPGPWKSSSIFPIPRRRCCRWIFSRINIETGEKSGVFMVPQRAITELQGVRTVYVVNKEGGCRSAYRHGRRAPGESVGDRKVLRWAIV